VEIDVDLIVMRPNENQVEDFISWVQDLGVDTASVIDSCVRNMEKAREFSPSNKRYWFYDEEAYERGFLKPKYNPDNEWVWMWNSILINWQGDALP
jgi:hypothetical protein